MKSAAFLLGLTLATAKALAIEHVVFNETAPVPLVARALRDPDFWSWTWTVTNPGAMTGTVAAAIPTGTISHNAGFTVPSIGDQSAIARFYLPPGAAGRNCQVILNLDPTGVNTAGAQFEVFMLDNYPVVPGPWAPTRGPPLGVLTANTFLTGTTNGDSSGAAATFPCDGAAGGYLTLEFAPYVLGTAGESIAWNTVNGGPIVYINP